MALQDTYHLAYEDLLELGVVSSEMLPRLNEIFEFTEQKWNDNVVQRIKNRNVKYLLIAEAAPWSPSDPPTYFYGQPSSSLHGRVLNALYDRKNRPPQAVVFDKLAEKGFVLIDTLPFAAKYTTNHRTEQAYIKAVRNCVANYFLRKINMLNWADEVKVAFAFFHNGQAILNALENTLPLPDGRTISISNEMIVADGSGYPNPDKLRLVYEN